jgi:hypothetical protein
MSLRAGFRWTISSFLARTGCGRYNLLVSAEVVNPPLFFQG